MSAKWRNRRNSPRFPDLRRLAREHRERTLKLFSLVRVGPSSSALFETLQSLLTGQMLRKMQDMQIRAGPCWGAAKTSKGPKQQRIVSFASAPWHTSWDAD